MKKRLFAILTALTLCLTMLPTTALAGNVWSSMTANTEWYNTSDTSFSIGSAEQLAGLAQIVNGTASDIAQDSFAGKTITLESDITLGSDYDNGSEITSVDRYEWKPIGTSDTPFRGTFDGNHHSVNKLFMPVAGNNQGFFGYIKDSVICNVTLNDVLIYGDTNVGGIAGSAENSTITGCTVNSIKPSQYSWGIRGSESVGGIVGCSQDSYIKDCKNSAYVYLLTSSDEPARHKLGGIAGVATLSAGKCSEEDAVLIADCTNTGPITCTTEANYECTGGIVGRLVSDNKDYRAIVTDCENTAPVSSIEAGTGGIVGYAQNASIKSCENKNTITGTTGVGGIAGYAYYGTQILDCTNSDSVTGKLYSTTDTTVYPYNIGGIVGSIYNPRDTTHLEGDCDSLPVYSYNRDSLISNCTNSGDVTCEFDWPEAEATIRLVDGVPYAINIFGSFVGGIAGMAVDSAYFDEEGNVVRIESCENSGTVTGTTYSGGVLGIGKNADVIDCTNSGIVADADKSDSDSIRADIGGCSYTVRFDANGGAVKAEDTLKLAVYGVLDSLPTPTRSGSYRFDGWFTEKTGGTAITTQTVFNGNSTIYAHWTADQYTVILNTGGGTIQEGNVTEYTYGVGATLPTDVTKTGYTFAGWYDNKACTGDPVTAISDTATEAKEYWAKWTVNQYTITFVTNGGTEIAPITQDYNTAVNVPDDPTKTGYTFAGWDKEIPTTMPAEDVIITAKWTVNQYTNTVESPKNGTVTVSPQNPEEGAKVTITPKPDEDYAVNQVIVTDPSGSSVEVADNGDGTYSFTQPAGNVTIKVVFGDATVVPFVDVPADAYYYDAVQWAVRHGITYGTSNTTFSPNESCTRAQMVTFLWRAAGCPTPQSSEMPFKDVGKGSYYEKAVLWAVENGITYGTSATTFSPNATCSRAQFATFLWRFQGTPKAGTSNPFTDVAEGTYYTDAVLWAAENGITEGTSATTFSPDADCTRAQTVTFLYRCLGK